jgi:hypothetical protein
MVYWLYKRVTIRVTVLQGNNVPSRDCSYYAPYSYIVYRSLSTAFASLQFKLYIPQVTDIYSTDAVQVQVQGYLGMLWLHYRNAIMHKDNRNDPWQVLVSMRCSQRRSCKPILVSTYLLPNGYLDYRYSSVLKISI